MFATRSRAESLSLASTSVQAADGKGGSGGSKGNGLALIIGARSGQCGAEGAGARSDGGERGERSGTRQDAAGGESRGRRDGEPRGGRERTDAQRQEGPRGFAATLTGETAQRTEPKRRAG